MRLRALAVRNLRELYRDRLGMGFLLGFPLVFMVVFGLAFRGEQTNPVEVAVVNQSASPMAGALAQAIRESPVLKVAEYDDLSQAREAVRLREITAVIRIPPEFGQGLPSRLELIYDPGDPVVGGTLGASLNGIGSSLVGQPPPLILEHQPLRPEITNPVMNWMAPGMILFGLLILIPTAARRIVEDKERGFLARLLTTPLSPRDFLLGYALPPVLFSFILIPLYLVVASLLGLKIVGSVLLAGAFFLLVALFSIGLGLILATLMRSHEQTEGFSWLVLVPLGMFSELWFPARGFPGFIRAFADVLPLTYAARASRDVVSRGAGIETVGGELLILLAWTVVAFGAGIVLFRRAMAR